MGGWFIGHVQGMLAQTLSGSRVVHTFAQPEFRPILFPIFCHFYLDLVQQGYREAGTYGQHSTTIPCLNRFHISAQNFYSTFSPSIPSIHHTTLHHLSTITLPYHVQTDEVAQRFRSEKYTIRMSRAGLNLLIGWLTEGFGGEPTGAGDGFSGEKGKRGRAAVMRVVNNHLRFEGTHNKSIILTIANMLMQSRHRQAHLCPLGDGRSQLVSSLRLCHRRMGAMWMPTPTTRQRASSSSVLPPYPKSFVQRRNGHCANRPW